MITSGAFPITDGQLQGSHNGGFASTGETPAGDFSALLFLILGNMQIPARVVAGASETAAIPGSAALVTQEPADAGREDTEPQPQATEPAGSGVILMQLMPDALAPVSTQCDVNPIKDQLPAATDTSEFDDKSVETTGVVEAQVFHAVTAQNHGPESDGAISTTATSCSPKNNAAADAQCAWMPVAENVAVKAHNLDARAFNQSIDEAGPLREDRAGNTERTTVVTPAEAISATGAITVDTTGTINEPELSDHHTGRSEKLPADGATKANKLETTDNVKGLQVHSNDIASGETYTRNQGPAAYARDGMTAAVSNSARGHAVIEDDGLNLRVPVETQTGRIAEDAALAATPNGSGKDASTNSHQGEQGSLFHQRFQDSSNQPGQAPLHAAWHDRGSVYSTYAAEVTPEAPARALDWRPVVDHVAGEIRGHIRIGKSEAVIRLDPPELGSLKIDLRMEGDKVEARIYAENHDSATLIEGHLPELRQALAESRVEHIEVRLDNASWSSARGDRQQGRRQEAGDGQPQAHDSNSGLRNDSKEPESPWPQAGTRAAGRVSMWV